MKPHAIGDSRAAATDPGARHPKNASVHSVSASAVLWAALLALFAEVFTTPTAALFRDLATAGILCPARRTVTGMIRGGGILHRRPHDAYHRLVRAAAWSLDELWDRTADFVIGLFAPSGSIDLLLDDTLFHYRGRKVHGGRLFRARYDPPRTRSSTTAASTSSSSCSELGPHGAASRSLFPWRSAFTTREGRPSRSSALGRSSAWPSATPTDRSTSSPMVPTCRWRAWNSLAPRSPRGFAAMPPSTTSLLLVDRGHPRKKGDRLPSLTGWTSQSRTGWESVVVDRRGRLDRRLLLSRVVLWYGTCGARPVRVVVSRDPAGHGKDDFLFTTDLAMSPGAVVSTCLGRWPIEETLRSSKQSLGGQEP